MELIYSEDGTIKERHEFPHDDDDELYDAIIELCDSWNVDVSHDEVEELMNDEIVWLSERTFLRLDK